MATIDEIWSGDLFGRKTEAEQLLQFVKGVAERPSLREDAQGYVLAVDGPYGEGKSFFLRRFAQHVQLTNPVAFVDAWADDLEDEPLVALAATLDLALTPFADKSEDLKKRIATFKEKSGAVAKIVAIGLVKRLGSLLIMDSGAEAVDHVIDSASTLQEEFGKEVIKKAADGIVDGIAEGASQIVSGTMQERIDTFRAGQKAILEMKAALRAIVEYLGQDDIYPPPIVVIVDELDRCRPTYAVKLLEEIKHLFDVPGIVFVLGMHGGALSHSVSAAYGQGFDGSAYLRRFFNKTYRLRPAPLYPLVQWLFRQRDLEVTRLEAPMVQAPERYPNENDPANVVASYMEMYGFTARDAFGVVDGIETALTLSKPTKLLMPLFIPLLLASLRGSEGLLNLVKEPQWQFVETDNFDRPLGTMAPGELAYQIFNLASQSDDAIMNAVRAEEASFAGKLMARYAFHGIRSNTRLDRPQDYQRLLRTVGRFDGRTT